MNFGQFHQSSGSSRYQSAPSLFFANILDNNGGVGVGSKDCCHVRPLGPEVDIMLERFISSCDGLEQNQVCDNSITKQEPEETVRQRNDYSNGNKMMFQAQAQAQAQSQQIHAFHCQNLDNSFGVGNSNLVWQNSSLARFFSDLARIMVGLWIFGGVLNVDDVTAAILGLSVLLAMGVVTWNECLAESIAWDTLTWFATIISMAVYLNKYGLISWFNQTLVKFVGRLGLSWQSSFGILVLLYFYYHYFFASGAAHIGAMFTVFLSTASALGTPPYFGAMVLAFLSNLMGGLTHYKLTTTCYI